MSSPNTTRSIPSTLPILTLPPETSLFPSLFLSITLPNNRRDYVNLIQAVLKDVETSPGNKQPIIGVVPLRPGAGNGKGKDGAEEENKLQVIKLPSDIKSTGDREHGGASGEGNGGNQRPSIDEIHDSARICRINRVVTNTNGSGSGSAFTVVVEGLARIRIDRFTSVGFPCYEANVSVFGEQGLPHTSSALLAQLKGVGNALLDTINTAGLSQTSSTSLPPMILKKLRSFISASTLSSAGSLADALISALVPNNPSSHEEKLEVLAIPNPEERVAKVVGLLSKLNEVLLVSKKIGERVEGNLTRQQREFYLRNQMKAIRDELEELSRRSSGGGGGSGVGGGGGDGFSGAGGEGAGEKEEDEFKVVERQIAEAKMTPEALAQAQREFKRLQRIPPQSVEHGVIRTYLETLCALPWTRSTPLHLERDFLNRARKQLDGDHYGLVKVKRRLVEYLAVQKLSMDLEQARLRRERDEERKERESEGSDKDVLRDVFVEGKEPDVNGLSSASGSGNSVQPVGESSPTPTPIPPFSTPPSKKPEPRDPSPPKSRAPILLLVGPPGVGKTSIARSLATAMGRKFHRISLGGIRDEAEIRGHRRTYVGAMPGLICQALRKVGTNNPLILLDEIDKCNAAGGFHGDPAAALLEVLDGQQNYAFNDHYVNVPVDLSNCLFVATANTLDTISHPLMDRMEVIELSGYITDEKLNIARRHLLPKQVEANMLQPEHIKMSDQVLLKVITAYTFEAGVRNLEREIGSVCRAKAVQFAELRDADRQASGAIEATPESSTEVTVSQDLRPSSSSSSSAAEEERVEIPNGYNPVVTLEDLEIFLGPAKIEDELAERDARPGVVTGLAYQGTGNGTILRVESTSMPGSGQLRLTGNLGTVIEESARIALSWIRSNAVDLGLAANAREDILKEIDIHLHLPSGAVKKDGPSAGVTMVTSLVSLFSGEKVDQKLAMTGEITLRGMITPVGGIREKVLAAHRSGIKKVLLPYRNRKDVDDELLNALKGPSGAPSEELGKERESLQIVYVKTLWDALEQVFGDRLWRGGEDDGKKKQTGLRWMSERSIASESRL